MKCYLLAVAALTLCAACEQHTAPVEETSAEGHGHPAASAEHQSEKKADAPAPEAKP